MKTHDQKRGMSFGRWMIERERCRIPAFRPPPPDCEGIEMAEGIGSVLKALGVEHEEWTAMLPAAWPSLVGAQVARHTRPGRIRDGELAVFVDSSVWFSELRRYGVKSMLSNLQDRYGQEAVTTIRLQLDPDRRR